METFTTFQATKNNLYACIKCCILFQNVSWPSVPEYPDILSLVQVGTSGTQREDNRLERVKESITEEIMLKLGCDVKRQIS